MAADRKQLAALRELIGEADHILQTLPPLPENRTTRAHELLTSALALTDDMLRTSRLPVAAVLGRKGGSQTAKRGPEYFRQLAAMRKSHGGGRPRKESD